MKNQNLGELSQDLLLEIHMQVDPGRKADEVQVSEARVLGEEGSNRVLSLGYKSYSASFQNGEYECSAVIDSEGRLVEVRSRRALWA